MRKKTTGLIDFHNGSTMHQSPTKKCWNPTKLKRRNPEASAVTDATMARPACCDALCLYSPFSCFY